MKTVIIEVAITVCAFVTALFTCLQCLLIVLLQAISSGDLYVDWNDMLVYSFLRSITPGIVVGLLITVYAFATAKRSK